MKCLAIADLFIDKEMMEKGLAKLIDKDIQIEIREWNHDSIEKLQEDNIKTEHQGSEAISLPEELLENLDTFDIVITQFAPIGKDFIDRCTNLKYLGVLRAGTENVNIPYAESKNITVLNTPGRSITSVSEFTVGMILSEIRNISRANQKLKQGIWEKHFPSGILSPELKKSKIALIGYGAIGQKVAELLRPFGGDIMFYDEYYEGDTLDSQVHSLNELVSSADIISMHYRLTNKTKHMLNKEHFNLMKPNAIVINTARSGLINEKDLIEALQKNTIQGAAVDVFDNEPLPEDHPYLNLENVTITPHIAGSTYGNFADSPVILCDRILNLL